LGYDWRMTNGQHPPLELTIGVVGSHDLVEQIMLSGTAIPAPATGPAGAAPAPRGNGQATGGYSTAPAVARRLVAVAYRTEQEAGDKVLRLGPGIDVWLFASRIPYLYAGRQACCASPPRTCHWAAAPCTPPCCGRPWRATMTCRGSAWTC
jgi:hypothetical protein